MPLYRREDALTPLTVAAVADKYVRDKRMCTKDTYANKYNYYNYKYKYCTLQYNIHNYIIRITVFRCAVVKCKIKINVKMCK